jgi:hypothetical protein
MTAQFQTTNPIDEKSGPMRKSGSRLVFFFKSTIAGFIILFFLVLSLPGNIRAQGSGSSKGAGGNPPAGQSSNAGQPSGNSSTPGAGGSALQGISFAKGSWNSELKRVPTPAELGIGKAEVIVLCYKLVAGNSAAQPFILQAPLSSTIYRWQPNKEYKKGTLIVYSSILYPNNHYFRAKSNGWSGRDAAIFQSPSGKLRTDGTIYWEDMGDTAWHAGHAYKKGDVIAPTGLSGHFYQASSTGKSATAKPAFEIGKESLESDGKLAWIDVGTAGESTFPPICTNINPSEPILMNQVISIAIDMSAILDATSERFKILNLNLTNQQGAPLNPTPIRPGLAASTATGPAISSATVGYSGPLNPATSQVYYLTWPNQLPGDTIPTIGVNLVYTPVAPALPWKAQTFYPAGSIVISKVESSNSSTTNGHYYLALNSGTSSKSAPNFDAAAVPVPIFTDGPGIGWKDMGFIPNVPWTADTPFDRDALIVPNPPNGHYYRAENSGETGSMPPNFPMDGSEVSDKDLRWKDVGSIPNVPWKSNTSFDRGALIVPNAANGHYYQAQNSGTTGTSSPGFPNGFVMVRDGPGLVWKESGTTTTPPVWKATYAYAEGATVTPDPPNGRYYRAHAADGKSGLSGVKGPAFPVDRSTQPDTDSLSWEDMGPSPVFPAWQPNTAFANHAVIVPSPANGHYYQAQMDGVTGPNQPAFPVTSNDNVFEPSNLVWIDAGPTLPNSAKNTKTWLPTTAFFVGDVIQDTSSGHYYSVLQAGFSGSTPPNFSIPAPGRLADTLSEPTIDWQDLGASLPASVSSVGTTPSDQTLNLLSYTLPQVHALSYFNLASGVVVSSIKTNSFVNTGTSSAPNWTSTKNGITVDPILALTAYFKPIDAERPWRKSDLIPGATLAFSLSSPTTNFYFGASSEFPKLRNVQMTYGFSLVRGSVLEPPFTSSAAVTNPHFFKGGFVGLTFNITGFIQSLF